MLQFILGRASTGKSYTIFERIRQDVLKGESVVLLVPEQFTFECERTLLRTLGDKASTSAQVLSFTRLVDEVSRKIGGRVADTVTENDKVILMGRALNEIREELTLWKKYANSPKFIETMLACINELKAAAISPDTLLATAQQLNDGYLKNKAQETSLIYGAYNALLSNRFIDPQDNIERLAENLLKYRFFEGKNVYIDSFKSFTGGQYKIIDRALSQAQRVVCGITAPDLDYSALDAFSEVRCTAKRITQMAEAKGLKIADALILREFHYTNPSMLSVESIFSGENNTENGCDGITLCRAETVFDEAEFVARTIRKLVRQKGYRYRDFVIIARNADKYQNAILNSCEKNGVFCFCDKRKSIENTPLTVLINSYFKLARSVTTDAILTMLKTGLGPIDGEDACEIENYTYIWNITGKNWYEKWNMNPDGFSEGMREKARLKLEKLNENREKILSSIQNFKQKFAGTPAQMARAVVELVEELSVPEKLKAVFNDDNFDLELREDIRQSYDLVMQILDGIVKCLPDNPLSAAEFIDNWNLSVSSVSFGNIPQMLDEVTFGSADRIRPSRPKVALVLGANEGDFPQAVKNTGIFADSERQALKELGLDMLSTDLNKAIEENYLIYSSLCCPQELLYITYNSTAENGIKKEPSEIVSTLKAHFGEQLKTVFEPAGELSDENIPETLKTAVSRMCVAYNTDKVAYSTINSALSGKCEISAEEYSKRANKQNTVISSENARALYGSNIYISPTKFDTFHKCKFWFFCKYAVNTKKLQAADFNVLQRGTIVHSVLQGIISEYGKSVGSLTREQCDGRVDFYIEEYLSRIEGFGNIVTARMRYLISKISELVKDVAYHLVREFAQSDFSPEYCELKIGFDGVVPEKVLKVEEQTKFLIHGSIDRVDIWNGYVRVVDYKTGTKKFQLSSTLVGLNLQMLIYLYSLVKGDNPTFNNLKSAGVLYAPSKKDNDKNNLTMNGIILDEEQVYKAMEKENEGEFIPKHNSETPKEKENTYISAEVFDTVFQYIEKLMNDMWKSMLAGNLSALPTDFAGKQACEYCDYYAVCCLENREHNEVKNTSNAEALKKMKEVL